MNNLIWPFVVLALFIGFAFLGLYNLFGDFGHIIYLLLFASSFIYLIHQSFKKIKLPNSHDVERKIEISNKLKHRPLNSLDDKLANPDQLKLSLWQKHKTNLSSKMKNLHAGSPKLNITSQDKYGLRLVVLIFVILSFIISGDNAMQRLNASVTPNIFGIDNDNTKFDIWIVPPEYTKKAPIFLRKLDLENKILEIPKGSKLTIRVKSDDKEPITKLDGTQYKFSKVDNSNYSLEHDLQNEKEIVVKLGFRTLGTWNIKTSKDMQPIIYLNNAPEITEDNLIKIDYTARDDFGVKSISANLELEASAKAKFINNKDINLEILDLSKSVSDIEDIEELDLTSSIWSGFPIIIQLTAKDDLEQIAITKKYSITLPEKIFKHPVAQAIIKNRKELILANKEAEFRIISKNILNIASYPGRYREDKIVFLGLGIAGKRLIIGNKDNKQFEVIELLWDLALRIEDGNLHMSKRALKQAIKNMRDALKNDKLSDEEAQRLAAELQQAMQQYMQELMQELSSRMQEGSMAKIPPNIAEKLNNKIDMNDLMEQMKNLANATSKEDLEKMLDQMENIADNMKLANSDQQNKEFQEQMEKLEKLDEIIKKQQQLLDKTNKLDKNSDKSQATKLSQEQQSLKKELGELMLDIAQTGKEIPEKLGKAEREMASSQNELFNNNPAKSAEHQRKILGDMQDEMEKQLNQAAEQMKNAILSFGMGGAGMPSGGKGGKDPLGRDQNGKPDENSDVKIPGKPNKKRIQEILKELRDRSNDYDRPEIEREYLKRLLKRF